MREQLAIANISRCKKINCRFHSCSSFNKFTFLFPDWELGRRRQAAPRRTGFYVTRVLCCGLHQTRIEKLTADLFCFALKEEFHHWTELIRPPWLEQGCKISKQSYSNNLRFGKPCWNKNINLQLLHFMFWLYQYSWYSICKFLGFEFHQLFCIEICIAEGLRELCK